MVKHLNVKSFRDTPENNDVLLLNDRGLWHEENCKTLTSASRGELALHKDFSKMLEYCKGNY